MPLFMNDTQSKEVINSLVDGLKLNPATDNIPKSVIPTIQPTYDVQRRKLITIVDTQSTATTQTNTTIYTCSTTRDTYLKGVQVAWTSDATADNTNCTVGVKIDPLSGISVIFRLLKQSLTADSQNGSVMFDTPIKLTRGSTITQSNTFSVGASTLGVQLFMYEEEPDI